MNDELIEYYINLLILQYRDKPRARGTIGTFIRALMIFDVIRQVENGFDVLTAVGVQLDILSKYIGTQRAVTPTSDVSNFFASVPYAFISPTIAGFVGSIRNDELTLPPYNQVTYDTQISNALILSDTDFRFVNRAKIFQNTMPHTVESVYNFLQTFFPGTSDVTDNLDMTITYTFAEANRRMIEILQSENVLPKPAGVSFTVVFTP